MDPSLEHGQRLMANVLAYSRWERPTWARLLDRNSDGLLELFGAPRRGDIVYFQGPGSDRRHLIKRVIGLPGEEVEIRGGAVFINGQQLPEPYVVHKSTDSEEAVRLLLDEYWVLGDNRLASTDSRTWGPVPRENIGGRVWFSYWPIGGFGPA